MSRAVQRLTVFMLEKGVSQAALARRAGISRFYLNRIIGEGVRPGIVVMTKIELATQGVVKRHHWHLPKLRPKPPRQ